MATFELQKIIYSAISDLSGGRVFDYVPETTAYPFVSISDSETDDNSGDLYTAKDGIITLNVWGQSEGFADISAICDAIYERLHYAHGLQSPNYRVVYIYERNRKQRRDPDGKTRRIIATYVVRLEKV